MNGSGEIFLLILFVGLVLSAIWAAKRIRAKVGLLDEKLLIPGAIVLGALIISAAILAKNMPRYQAISGNGAVAIVDTRTGKVSYPNAVPMGGPLKLPK